MWYIVTTIYHQMCLNCASTARGCSRKNPDRIRLVVTCCVQLFIYHSHIVYYYVQLTAYCEATPSLTAVIQSCTVCVCAAPGSEQ